MITTTKDYQDMILNDQRELKMKIILNGTEEIDGHYLKNVTIHEVSNGLETLTIGSICSNSIKIDMFDPGDGIFDEGSIEVYMGLQLSQDMEWVPMGTFFISEVIRNNAYEVVLEGYDSVSLLNVDYVPENKESSSIYDIVMNIITQCHLSIDKQYLSTLIEEHGLENFMIHQYYEVTCKEMLSYMASLMGMNARINRYNQVEFFWYTDHGYSIPLHLQYQSSFKKTNSSLIVSSLTSGSEDNVISCGSGYGITFMNPYMTQDILENIYQNLHGFTYTPASVKWRGDPSLEVCDCISVQTDNECVQMIIMDNTMIFDGGMSSSIECQGQNEKEVTMSGIPTEIKLKRFYNTLTQSFQQLSEKILGHQGGYYQIDVDENGYPCGWTIMDTPILRDDTRLWKMSINGFGFSHDGGKTFENLAFDLDGNFSANAITTGILQGNCFDLDLNSGTILIGERNQDGLILNPVFRYDQNYGFYIESVHHLQNQIKELKNSINVTLTLNYEDYQIYDASLKKYYPDYTKHPLKIIAVAKDALKNEIVDAIYIWKRKTSEGYVDLIDDEVIDGHILTISHNLNESVEYMVSAHAISSDNIEISAQETISIDVKSISENETVVSANQCSIISSVDTFIENGEDYKPFQITLTPIFQDAHFNYWQYSTDLGIDFSNIVIHSDQLSDNHIISTDIDGITYNKMTHELIIEASSECFQANSCIVFQLNSDVQNDYNRIYIVKEKNIAIQVNSIIAELQQLIKSYHYLSLNLDALNASITSRVEKMEENNQDGINEIINISSEVKQTAQNIDLKFSDIDEIVNELGDMTQLKEMMTYFIADKNGLKISKDNADYSTLMATDHFAVLYGENEVMTLEKALMTIENIYAKKEIRLGNTIFSATNNGFTISWGGEQS